MITIWSSKITRAVASSEWEENGSMEYGERIIYRFHEDYFRHVLFVKLLLLTRSRERVVKI